MSLIVFLISLGAALRLTRLAIGDVISKPFRDFLLARASRASIEHESYTVDAAMSSTQPTERSLLIIDAAWASRRASFWTVWVELFDCPWCIGFWLSAGTTAAALSAYPIHGVLAAHLWTITYPALVLTTSWLVGFIYTIAYTLEVWEPNG